MPRRKAISSDAPPTADTPLSTYTIADMLDVSPLTIGNWVTRGILPATRTVGGHRRIRAGDIVALIKARGLKMPEWLRHLARPSVLLVDDEPRQLRAMVRLLEPFGERLDVHTAEDGINALLMLGELRPALVVIDVLMPGLDGIAVCQRIRARSSLSATRVIIVSAHMTPEREKDALAAGAARALQKPIAIATILELVGLEPKPEPKVSPSAG